MIERHDMAGRHLAALRRRYLSLGTGELAAAAMFGVAAATSGPGLGAAARPALWSALVPLLLVLVQAGAYWLLALRWVGRRPMPARAAAVYRTFRVTGPVVLAAGLVGVLTRWPDRWPAAPVVLAVWGFGVVEYLNYYVVRLAYPAGRWFTAVRRWRTPQLVRDLRDATR